MYHYCKEQVNELEKYNRIFPESKEIATLYKLAKITLSNEVKRKDIVEEIKNQVNSSKDTLYYWQKKYQKYGVTRLLNARELIVLFLHECNKPINYWNKRLLKEQVEKGIEIRGEEVQIEVSLTLCGDILKEQKSFELDNRSNKLNKLYRKMKDNYYFLFLDYFRIPNKPNELTTKAKYCFIFMGNDYLKLHNIVIDRRDKLKHENEIIIAFQRVISLLEEDDLNAYIVMKDTRRNRIIMDTYNMSSKKDNILVGEMQKLNTDLKYWFREMTKIRKELVSRPEIIQSVYSKNKFIENHRLRL